MPRIYCPFPDDESPEDWPTEYVALSEYQAILLQRDRARMALKQIATSSHVETAARIAIATLSKEGL